MVITAVIGIATYKRPNSLRTLLESLHQQDLSGMPEYKITICIVDNDSEGSAKSVVESVLKGNFPFQIDYEIEPLRGITYVRNRIVKMAGEDDYLIFIDDDEVAQQFWLRNILNTAINGDTAIVAGPVQREFMGDPPAWVHSLKLFTQKQYPAGSFVSSTGTGNVVLRTSILKDLNGPFDNRFALIGGSDSVLFAELRKKGHRILWCPKAIVTENVPASRLTVKWVLSRSFRIGYSSVVYRRLYTKGKLTGRIFSGLFKILKGVLLLLPCLIAFRISYSIRMLQELSRGLGIFWGVVGLPYEEYRKTHGG